MSDYFYTGYPVKTDYGLIIPIKVKDYPFVSEELNIIQMEDFEWVKEFKKYGIKTKNKKEFFALAKIVQEKGLMECIHENVGGMRDLYLKSLSLFVEGFDENPKNIFKLKTFEELDELVSLIYKVNGIPAKEKSKDDEVKKWINLKNIYKSRKSGGKITFTAMLSSVAKEFGYKPHDLNDLTLFQLFEDFNRIESFKSFEASTLFKTVDANNKIQIQSWYRSETKKEDIEAVNPTQFSGIKIGRNKEEL